MYEVDIFYKMIVSMGEHWGNDICINNGKKKGLNAPEI
jgi:hypothetical protein